MAIPYIDTNPKGNGYYTLKERRWEITTFLFGFLILWILLVILGTFLRGPNWNFFGPYEFWDIHKLEALVNVNLSEYIWVKGLGTGLPKNPLDSRDVRIHRDARILPVDSATAGEEVVQRLLPDAWTDSVPCHDVSLAVHDSAADQDGAALAV